MRCFKCQSYGYVAARLLGFKEINLEEICQITYPQDSEAQRTKQSQHLGWDDTDTEDLF